MNIQQLLQQGTQALICVSPVELEEFGIYLLERQAEQKADSERLYTRKEFAARHRVSLATLWRWEKQGVVKPTRYGNKVYYRDSDLKEN